MARKRQIQADRISGRPMSQWPIWGWLFAMAVLLTWLPPVTPDTVLAAAKGQQAGANIVIVSPPDGSFITEKTIFLSGYLLGDKADSVTISGVEVAGGKKKIAVKDQTFGVMVSFKKGLNTLSVISGKQKKHVRVYYAPVKKGQKASAPKGFKRFYTHARVGALTCSECHRKRRGKINFKRLIPSKSTCTTGKCHQDKGKNAAHVHGPVGAGICISCHNPHGSFEPLELERTGQELCYVCHQAKKNEFDKKVIHPPVEEGCVDCHDPHQSSMRFQLRGTGKTVSSLCFNCHEKEIFSKKHQHGPVATGDCVACHRPHASDNEKLLIAPTDEGKICFVCHENVKEQLAMKNTHDPAQEDCNNCHDPHSTDFNYQLKAPPKKLCASCHREVSPEVYQAIDTAKFKHPPVAQGECTKCHMPHGSEVTTLLKGKGIKLCGTCHEDLADQIADSTQLHGPVKTGSCTECHNVHGSGFSRLLVRAFPEKFYSDYQPQKYDLCFGCHNKEIAKHKKTKVLTNFRNGDENLHYFHVHRKKGRSCIACHDPHASTQAKHIRTEVPFGSWSYPIEFTKTKIGGGCVVGCHAPKKYNRVTPVMNK